MSEVNAPLSIWQPTSGNGEAVTVGVANLVDNTLATLVDTTGALLVSTGSDFNLTPLSVWTQDDSK